MPCAPNSRWPDRLWPARAALALLLGGALLWGCRPASPDIETQARRYAQLAVSGLPADEIDFSFGPPLPPADGPSVPPREAVKALVAELRAGQAQAPLARRARLLARAEQLDALLALAAQQRSLDFDREAALLYGLAPLQIDMAQQARARAALAELLPGPGPLAQRVAAWRTRFALPPGRREAVFARALAECRARTLAHWKLPAAERLSIEWTSRVPAAWHRYLGQYHSRLQINPAAVADPATALDLACHEAYPGHHAQFLLLEAQAGGVPVEDRVVLLRSPPSALREGSADHGVDLVFPPAEREAFMAGTLFPLAGFAAADAPLHGRVHRLIRELALSTAPILRRYREGRATREETLAALANEALVSSPEALLAFFEAHGTLVASYTVAQARVARCVDGAPDRWAALARLVTQLDIRPLGQPDDAPPCAGGSPTQPRPPAS